MWEMSKELELLQKSLEWMEELKYVWVNVRDSGDYDLLELIADISKIEKLLAQTEQDEKSKVDFQTLSELGLKRLQVSDNLVLQESCAKSPTVIFAENGNVEIIDYKKLLEIRSFIDEILNYADTFQIGVDDE